MNRRLFLQNIFAATFLTIMPTALGQRILASLLRIEDGWVLYFCRSPRGQVVFTINQDCGESKFIGVKVFDLDTGQLWAQRQYMLDMSASPVWTMTFTVSQGIEV